MTAIMPPVRTPASYQVIPDGCTCTWMERTLTLPWRWVRVAPADGCKAIHPEDSSEEAG